MVVELKADKRSVSGKGVVALRQAGKMPAVVYGPKKDATPVELSLHDFSMVLRDAGESTVINLNIGGEGHNVLIHDVDYDPVTSIPRHADFYAIVKGQKVEVEIPLSFVGESLAVKQGGNLLKALHEIEIKADPMDLPHSIEVDISSLSEMNSHILAKDLKLPAGVVLVTGENEVVATVVEAKEEEEAPVAAPDMEAIGISEERGKKEEEGEAAPAEGK